MIGHNKTKHMHDEVFGRWEVGNHRCTPARRMVTVQWPELRCNAAAAGLLPHSYSRPRAGLAGKHQGRGEGDGRERRQAGFRRWVVEGLPTWCVKLSSARQIACFKYLKIRRSL